jgi:hypothetical protein
MEIGGNSMFFREIKYGAEIYGEIIYVHGGTREDEVKKRVVLYQENTKENILLFREGKESKILNMNFRNKDINLPYNYCNTYKKAFSNMASTKEIKWGCHNTLFEKVLKYDPYKDFSS